MMRVIEERRLGAVERRGTLSDCMRGPSLYRKGRQELRREREYRSYNGFH